MSNLDRASGGPGVGTKMTLARSPLNGSYHFDCPIRDYIDPTLSKGNWVMEYLLLFLGRLMANNGMDIGGRDLRRYAEQAKALAEKEYDKCSSSSTPTSR